MRCTPQKTLSLCLARFLKGDNVRPPAKGCFPPQDGKSRSLTTFWVSRSWRSSKLFHPTLEAIAIQNSRLLGIGSLPNFLAAGFRGTLAPEPAQPKRGGHASPRFRAGGFTTGLKAMDVGTIEQTLLELVQRVLFLLFMICQVWAHLSRLIPTNCSCIPSKYCI